MTPSFTLTQIVERPFAQAVNATRDALADQGFGIISEIDLAETLRQKLGVVVPAQMILGACRPELAHRAIVANPSIASLLPCNVVIREVGEFTCMIEAFDPDEMARLSGDESVRAVAADARTRLISALGSFARDGREI